MPTTDDTDKLDAVYAATRPEEIARTYDGWAEGYDAEMAALGYRHPAICLALLARHLPRGAAPILDAGCGTGLVGEWLGLVGYPHAEGIDISEGMLRVAERKGVYRRLHRGLLGGDMPFADHAFAAVISAGVFTTGHVGFEAFEGLLRVVRPGGVVVLTVKDRTWAEGLRGRARPSGRRRAARRARTHALLRLDARPSGDRPQSRTRDPAGLSPAPRLARHGRLCQDE
jgi:predicted TPR repeat methyltransferase